MSKKTIKSNSANTTHGHVEFEQSISDFDAVVQMAAEKAEKHEESEPVFLRDTIIKLDEFKKYGLNQYFLRAILTDTHYTKTKAHNLVKDFLNNQ